MLNKPTLDIALEWVDACQHGTQGAGCSLWEQGLLDACGFCSVQNIHKLCSYIEIIVNCTQLWEIWQLDAENATPGVESLSLCGLMEAVTQGPGLCAGK